MTFWENVELSISGLLLNKMRSILTMLGIIIGIASVIAIFTVGDSYSNYMSSTMQSMGANNITVSVRQQSSNLSGGMMAGGGSGLTDKNKMQIFMIDALKEQYSSEIKAISLSTSVGTGKTTIGENYANVSILGINEGYLTANKVTLLKGRFFTEEENTEGKNLCVVSSQYASTLGLSGNVIGKQVDVKTNKIITTYTIVGVYEYQQSSSGTSTSSTKDVSTNMYIPINVANKLTGSSAYQSFTIVTNVGVNSTTFATQAATFMKRYYTSNSSYTVNATTMETMVDNMSSMINNLKLAIGAIAAIALLVGGIGVMNIMLVSITERTREIGTRKALGAKNSSIRIQFVIESALICLIGGIIGVLLGTVLGMIGAHMLGYPGSTDATTILLAVGFSILIGIFFGYYPANKAAKLDPIEALRYE